MESSLPIPTSVVATDLRYCTTRNNPVKINRATVSLVPIVDGKLLSFTFTAFTNQVIAGGEMVIDLLREGVQFHTEKFDLADGVISCPIATGEFVLPFGQVIPVGVYGTYSVKLKITNQDGRQLSWVALDFTIPRDLPDSFGNRGGLGGRDGRGRRGGRGWRGGRGERGPTISFPSLGGRGPTITFEFV